MIFQNPCPSFKLLVVARPILRKLGSEGFNPLNFFRAERAGALVYPNAGSIWELLEGVHDMNFIFIFLYKRLESANFVGELFVFLKLKYNHL
jgi:hypothetical protein